MCSQHDENNMQSVTRNMSTKLIKWSSQKYDHKMNFTVYSIQPARRMQSTRRARDEHAICSQHGEHESNEQHDTVSHQYEEWGTPNEHHDMSLVAWWSRNEQRDMQPACVHDEHEIVVSMTNAKCMYVIHTHTCMHTHNTITIHAHIHT